MKVPPGQTEETVLEAIEKACSILASSFVFGFYDRDDIMQQGRLFALEVLEKEKFNPKLPLAPFLYSHVRNRLINLKRDKLRRNDAPCRRCHCGTPCGDDGQFCLKYREWRDRNAAKANIMRPQDLANIADEHERRTRTPSNVDSDSQINEMVKIIDRKLSVELRASFLQMKAGVPIPKVRRRQVEEAVKEILRGSLPGTYEDEE